MNEVLGWLKRVVIGRSRDLSDQKLFHRVSLIALFAWVGLGADGLSSSCYGPEETFKALGRFPHLSLFVALAAILTILAICASYSQIIELFPAGGGGYLVASKLLSPAAGVVSGCALLVDYVLTVTISVASSGDALFSILPPAWHHWKLEFVVAGVVVLTLLNLRGVKETVVLWVPVFFLFVALHAFAFLYVIIHYAGGFAGVAGNTIHEVKSAGSQIGWWALLALLLKAYSMGAGTYTGIEAVSNGLPILREPRVATGKRTMLYMGLSLAITVGGLLVCYLLVGVEPQAGKTLNASLFERMTGHWPAATGFGFVLAALASEAALLFIAAQAGFLDGPRVLANMAMDRWFPTRFANLSDRFVTQNGVLLIGGAAAVMMLVSRGSVALLVVLYSINVFITFLLSQLGMVRHWWNQRRVEAAWKSKLLINGVGLLLTGFILLSLSIVKFHEGGWVTLVATGLLIAVAFGIKRHYTGVSEQLKRLDEIVPAALQSAAVPVPAPPVFDPKARTAVLFVNGFNGLGLHTVLRAVGLLGGVFKNYVFVQVGAVDAGNFKGTAEIARLKDHVNSECDRYVDYMQTQGFASTRFTSIGTDVVEEVVRLSRDIAGQFSNAVFFGGQLLFVRETVVLRWLHNHTIFTLQRRLFLEGLPFVILPIRVPAS
ncbi:MAG TPA: APC family permease [Methylomirabilota bacterium]|nr:APC family permease [Methylomirabilota bacterium]